MKLVGVPNSPYFRRVAISMDLLSVPFDTVPFSPFIDTEALGQLHPARKVPVLICDSGEKILDSTLIIHYIESLYGNGKSLWPSVPKDREKQFVLTGLAMAALEKFLQVVYETRLRPAESQHAPWLERITSQSRSMLSELEAQVVANPEWRDGEIYQGSLTCAVAVTFARSAVPSLLQETVHPALVELAAALERNTSFQRYALTQR